MGVYPHLYTTPVNIICKICTMSSQKIVIIAVIVVVTAAGLFFMISNKKNSETTQTENKTENVLPESKNIAPTETPLADDGHAHEH